MVCITEIELQIAIGQALPDAVMDLIYIISNNLPGITGKCCIMAGEVQFSIQLPLRLLAIQRAI